ncbi:MAG: DUF1961 family protein [Armatimonadota bacterium]
MKLHISVIIALSMILAVSAALAGGGVSPGDVVYYEDFSSGMDDWWVEGAEDVWVENGRLYVKANPEEGKEGFVATVWCKKQFAGDVKVEFDAHVIASKTNVNNINFFLLYSYPGPKTMWETRHERPDANYRKYHSMDGYIFTYLKSTHRDQDENVALEEADGRFRIRRCPGFNLLNEAYDYECNAGKTYHVTLIKKGTSLKIMVDGELYCEATDPDPLESGLIGLRTFRTFLWWDNIKVTQL